MYSTLANPIEPDQRGGRGGGGILAFPFLCSIFTHSFSSFLLLSDYPRWANQSNRSKKFDSASKTSWWDNIWIIGRSLPHHLWKAWERGTVKVALSRKRVSKPCNRSFSPYLFHTCIPTPNHQSLLPLIRHDFHHSRAYSPRVVSTSSSLDIRIGKRWWVKEGSSSDNDPHIHACFGSFRHSCVLCYG